MNSRTKKRTRDHEDTKPRWSYLEESTTDESPSPIIAITLPRRENEKKKREVTEDEHHTPWWKDFLLQFIRNQFKLDIHKLDDPGDPSHDRAWKDLHCRVQTLWWEGRDEEMPENFIENTYTILKLKDIFDDCRGSVWEEKDKEMSEAEECKREHEQKIIERGWDRSIVPPHEVATPPEPEYYEHEERNWKISSISTSSGIEYKHERDITPPIYKHEGDITPETDYEEHKGVTTADPENGMDDFEKRADVLTKLHIRFSGRLHFGKVFALAVKRNFEELQPDMVRDAAIAVGPRGDRTLTDVIRQHTPPKNQQYNPPLMFAFDDLIQDKDLVREKDLLRRENNDYDKSHNYEPSYLSCLAEPGEPFKRHDDYEELCHRCCEKPGWRYNGRVCHGAIFCEALGWCEYCQSPGYLYNGVCCPIICEWYHEKCIEKRSLEIERLVIKSRHDPPYISWFAI